MSNIFSVRPWDQLLNLFPIDPVTTRFSYGLHRAVMHISVFAFVAIDARLSHIYLFSELFLRESCTLPAVLDYLSCVHNPLSFRMGYRLQQQRMCPEDRLSAAVASSEPAE